MSAAEYQEIFEHVITLVLTYYVYGLGFGLAKKLFFLIFERDTNHEQDVIVKNAVVRRFNSNNIKGILPDCWVLLSWWGCRRWGWCEPTLTVPDVDTQTLYDVAEKVFAAIAIFVAIGLGIRFFKKA